MNARFLTAAVLLLGLIPWAVFSVSCGFAGDTAGKIPTMNAGGGGGLLPDGPGDIPPERMGEDEPSDTTLKTVIQAVVYVSDEVSDPSKVEYGDTLWDLGIRSKEQIIQFAGVLDIPAIVWAEYKAERLGYQIDDSWPWWFTSDPTLETFIYAMTIYQVAEMAHEYSDWSGQGK